MIKIKYSRKIVCVDKIFDIIYEAINNIAPNLLAF